MGRRLHALRVEAGRQVARVGAGAVETQRWQPANNGVGSGRGSDRSWHGRDCEPTGTVAMGRAQFSLQN
jgi:hypothetical protein